jgi:hypothetical protein
VVRATLLCEFSLGHLDHKIDLRLEKQSDQPQKIKIRDIPVGNGSLLVDFDD